MNIRQLSERLGNINEQLIEEAANVPNYAARRRGRLARRIASAAAALVVAVGGACALGSTVFAQEVEVPVEVLVEPESVTFEEYGITLMLPDGWKGNYAVDYDEKCVYMPSLSQEHGRCVLFWLGFYPEQLTKDEFDNIQGPWNVVPSIYIMTTADGTYSLHCASDVQYDPSNAAEAEAYVRMYREIEQIRFVVDRAVSME